MNITKTKLILLLTAALLVGAGVTVAVSSMLEDGDSKPTKTVEATPLTAPTPSPSATVVPGSASQAAAPASSDEETLLKIAKASVLARTPSLTILSAKVNGRSGDFAVVTVAAGNNVSADGYTTAFKKVDGIWVTAGGGKGVGLDFGQPDSESDILVRNYGFPESMLRSLQR